jgi:hypothetical protein
MPEFTPKLCKLLPSAGVDGSIGAFESGRFSSGVNR